MSLFDLAPFLQVLLDSFYMVFMKNPGRGVNYFSISFLLVGFISAESEAEKRDSNYFMLRCMGT
jgi:hypothetical protein